MIGAKDLNRDQFNEWSEHKDVNKKTGYETYMNFQEQEYYK